MTPNRKPNRLLNSTSPYLLQHAHNPVDWYEWGNEALAKAKAEDKPILVSIGYSSCHWCHVMERECFEKDNIAEVMNAFFVCIKVDREERPDVDQLYMDAVQAMGINGGWPLNVFLTPDQKPFYGGTYFPPQNWMQILNSINQAYNARRNEIEESAASLMDHLSRGDIQRFKQKSDEQDFNKDLESIFTKLSQRFDRQHGGLDKAPKFVMPSIWLWMLRCYYLKGNEESLSHTLHTLRCIARGGIYDQLGGGFSRYSVDGEWFAPHFEKMLYDNAQLLSLFSEAYAITKDQEFKTIVYETFEWLQNEMTHIDGGFYSALDADSEGIEGKFYCWDFKSIQSILGKDAAIICEYYGIAQNGNWEHDFNILHKKISDEDFLKAHKLDANTWDILLSSIKKILLHERAKRIRPGLDDKMITAWNAMMICGLIDCYKVFADEKFLSAALKNMHFINQNLVKNGVVFRSYKNKTSTTEGFLDDYAYLIQASEKLYQVTFDEQWLTMAEELTKQTISQFYDSNENYFNYTSNTAEKLIASKKDVFDNVIPSSNSIMASNLFHLGTVLENEDWKNMAIEMVDSLSQLIKTEPNYMTNWAIVWLEIRKGLSEVAFVGKDFRELRSEFSTYFNPFSITLGTETSSTLPLLKDKESKTESTIFVCHDKVCKLPVTKVVDALKQLN